MNLQPLVKIALAEVGVKEQGGENHGPRIEEYQRATWLDGTGWAWCAAFIDWCILQWLKTDPKARKALKLADDAAVEKWRPRTAGAWDLLKWARGKKLTILPDTAIPQAGDIMVFDMSHVGWVVAVSPTGKIITTVEGNTNEGGGREGDGVFMRKRARSMARAFIRLA